MPSAVDWSAGLVTVTPDGLVTRLPTPIAAKVLATVLYVALPEPHRSAAAWSASVRAAA